jgi:hypothetical protein
MENNTWATHTDHSTTKMKFASSATLLLAAALSTLSAAQNVIAQASAKPMIVKPGGLVTVSVETVFSEDFRRKLISESDSDFIVAVSDARQSTLSTTFCTRTSS